MWLYYLWLYWYIMYYLRFLHFYIVACRRVRGWNKNLGKDSKKHMREVSLLEGVKDASLHPLQEEVGLLVLPSDDAFDRAPAQGFGLELVGLWGDRLGRGGGWGVRARFIV